MLIAVAVVRRGVTPLPAAMVGDTAPLHRMGEVPPPDFPVEKKLMVPEPPVPAGKSMFATGLTVPPDAVLHPVDLATFALA